MRRLIASAATALAVGVTLAGGGTAVADSAASNGDVVTMGQFTCEDWGRYGVTDRRTPVHVGPSASSTVTGHIAAGERVRGYYRCVNSAGNVWYEITGNLGNDLEEKDARFIYSGYL